MSLRRFADIRVLLPLAIVVAIVASFFLVDPSGDGEAEATVSEIVDYNGNGHIVFVDFVTVHGVSCHSDVDAGAFGYDPEPVVGARFRVNYDKDDPCGYVQRQSPQADNDWGILVPVIILAALGLVYWRRPDMLPGLHKYERSE